MSKITKIIGGLAGVVIAVVAIVAIAIATIDINQYRGQIADALSKQTGRSVKFGGPIHLTVSSHGIGLAVQDVSIGNPSWASRPQMAGIGKLELHVALAPLLQHKFDITALTVSNADIRLETNANNQHNWDMKPAAGATPATPATPTASSSASNGAVGVSVKELSIADSQIAMRDKNGETSTFKVEKVTMSPSSRGAAVSVKAEYNGVPLKLDLKTGASDLMADSKWPFDADVTYGNYHIKSQGNADTTSKIFELSSYELNAGGSALHGQLTANLGGARTNLRGSVAGDKIDMADFKPPSAADQKSDAAGGAEIPSGSKRLFSANPLDLSGLKSADANISVSIGEAVVGKTSLKQIGGTLALANGTLTLAPFKATLGDNPLQGDIKLEATSPARYSLSFKAPGIDIANLLEMSGNKAFLSGKGDADIDLSGSGASLHDMAANTNGHIIITAGSGTINAAAAGSVASGLAQILSPGASNPTLTCAAARFNVAEGVAKDNGILADSSASTVAGTGGFNLGAETIDLTLNAKPKNVNTRGLTPALRITGPLNGPNFGIDTVGAAQNVAGTLLKDKLGKFGGLLGGSSAEAIVPALQTAPAGQNACIYTLDHKAAAAAAAPAPNSGVKNTSAPAPADQAKDLGNQLMKGLLGH